MPVERGWRARLHYRTDQFLSSGPGKQLLLLFALTMGVVLLHMTVALVLALPAGDTIGDKFWFYFMRILDTGSMGDDKGLMRVVSAIDTVMGLVVAGLLISALAGNFQERLEAIRRGGSTVVEKGHFLILGWSDKIYSVIDQLCEANLEQGRRITVVVMAERDKLEMEEKLRDKVQHIAKIKLVVRSGSSVSISDLSRVAYDHAQAIVVLVDEHDTEDPDRADGRIIKTLLAIYNHPDGFAGDKIHVTAEVLGAANQDIAQIASRRLAKVVKTNEMISKIILQTSRISGLSIVYDELLGVEGAEVHSQPLPQAVGRNFSDLLLDFPNGCLCGVAKKDGSSHILNPPADYVIADDDELLI